MRLRVAGKYRLLIDVNVVYRTYIDTGDDTEAVRHVGIGRRVERSAVDGFAARLRDVGHRAARSGIVYGHIRYRTCVYAHDETHTAHTVAVGSGEVVCRIAEVVLGNLIVCVVVVLFLTVASAGGCGEIYVELIAVTVEYTHELLSTDVVSYTALIPIDVLCENNDGICSCGSGCGSGTQLPFKFVGRAYPGYSVIRVSQQSPSFKNGIVAAGLSEMSDLAHSVVTYRCVFDFLYRDRRRFRLENVVVPQHGKQYCCKQCDYHQKNYRYGKFVSLNFLHFSYPPIRRYLPTMRQCSYPTRPVRIPYLSWCIRNNYRLRP